MLTGILAGIACMSAYAEDKEVRVPNAVEVPIIPNIPVIPNYSIGGGDSYLPAFKDYHYNESSAHANATMLPSGLQGKLDEPEPEFSEIKVERFIQTRNLFERNLNESRISKAENATSSPLELELTELNERPYAMPEKGLTIPLSNRVSLTCPTGDDYTNAARYTPEATQLKIGISVKF